jgi:hypothetical protein
MTMGARRRARLSQGDAAAALARHRHRAACSCSSARWDFFVTPALMGSPRQMMLANVITFQVQEALDWPKASAIAPC